MAVRLRQVEALLERLISAGHVFTEDDAEMDLHVAIDKQQVLPYRDYMERWGGWPDHRVRALFVKVGIFPPKNRYKQKTVAQDGAKVAQDGAEPHVFDPESKESGAKVAQDGAKVAHSITDSEQNQTMKTDTVQKVSKRRRAKAVVPPPDPQEVLAALSIPEHLESPEFRAALEKWIRHRTTHPDCKAVKKPWPEFFQGEVDTRLAKRSHGAAVAMLRHSELNEWQGLFPDPDYKESAPVDAEDYSRRRQIL